MDITNIPQTLIKGLEQKNTEQLVALSRVLNLVLGKTTMAEISSTKPVTETERAELIKQTAAALVEINKQVSNTNNLTPALKAEMSRLLQQQNLVQSPELKWVNLVVNNRPLLTYSDRPLVAGQIIPVQLQSPQKLVLLDLPETHGNPASPTKTSTAESMANGATIQSPITKNIAVLNELLKTAVANLTTNTDETPTLAKSVLTAETASGKQTLATNTTTYSAKDLSQKFAIHTDNKNTNPGTAAAKTIVSENLRTLLPHKDTPNVLLSAIAKFQQLPATSRLQLVSPNLEQALKSVAAKIRSPEQLSQPKVLAQVLKNSGVFFEHKLNETVQNNSTKNVDANSSKTAFNHTYTQDLKGALLTLLNRTTQDINGDKKPLNSEQTQKLVQQLGSMPFFNPSLGAATTFAHKGDIAQILNIFMQQLMLKPVKELSDKELRTQLLTLIQQHSVHSLAKIQLQQLHTLNHELDTKDSSTPGASWQLEIPVKHHNEVHPLQLRIDREWVDEHKESDTEKNINKVKQWSVTLTFDLPTLGEFCAQLAIINTQVSATLWAAQEQTFTQVRDHIEGLRKQLENEGINVKYLQCVRGVPPQKPMALSYSLIDIST